MGLLFGYLEEESITAPFVTTEYSQSANENSAESSNSRNNLTHSLGARGSTKESVSDPSPQKASKKRGKTRGKGQKLQYLDGSRWVPAVYHHDIRGFLIKDASQYGEYTYPRERGSGLYDVTSFLESQKNWGPVRDKNWASILYVFQNRENHKDPSYELKNWKFHGKIIISAYDDRPMRRFRDLPDTLSSALHGRDMEAMKRTDPRIQQRDFMARMPLRHTTHAGTRRPLHSASSIGMRMTRFRQQEGMLSWIGRDGSQAIRNALWERLPSDNKLANSIRGLEPPSVAEQLEIKKGNIGKFLNRAGRRALTSEERARRQAIVERRLKNRQERGLGSCEGKVSDEVIVCRRPADDLGVDGLAEPDADGHRARHGRPKNGSWQPHEERTRKQRELKLRLRERQEVRSPGGGISDDGTRFRRPANSLNADGFAQSDTEQIEYIARPDRPENRSRQPRRPRHEMLERRDIKRQEVNCPRGRIYGGIPPTNNTSKPGKIIYQLEQDYNQVANPISEQDHDIDYSGDLFGSDLPTLTRDFDLDSFLEELPASNWNLSNVPSPPIDCELEDFLLGLPPAGFNNRDPSQSSNSCPDGGWNFNYCLPGSRAGLDHRKSSNNYPSPPNYNFTLEEVPINKPQQPYNL